MARRTRCIRCTELTYSGWRLGYPDPKDPKKWLEGTHCFKCSETIRKQDPDVKVSV